MNSTQVLEWQSPYVDIFKYYNVFDGSGHDKKGNIGIFQVPLLFSLSYSYSKRITLLEEESLESKAVYPQPIISRSLLLNPLFNLLVAMGNT